MSKYLKKCRGLMALGVSVASLIFAPLSSLTAYATSPYDSTWRHTTDISLQSPSCGAVDKSSEIAAQLESDSGWPSTAERDYYHAITTGSTPGFISITKTHQAGTNWTWVSLYVQQGTAFDAIWGNDDGNGHYLRVPGPSFSGTSYSGQWIGFMLDDSTCNMTFVPIGGTSVAYISNAGDATVFNQENIDLLFKNGAFLRPHYPDGYAGTVLGSNSTDIDNDSLTEAQEFTQGTSDGNKDTDGDGIDDKAESVLNANRDDQFCDTSTPKNCAYPDPTQKDLFVEIDWIYDGTTDFKPTSTQLNLIKNMFSAHGITAHFDLGEFGGGNRLPVSTSNINWGVTSGALDIQDFKNGGSTSATGLSTTLPAQFNSSRQNIWRYMVYGVSSISDLGASVGGVADGTGDKTIIASENSSAVYGYQYSKDRALAGLMAHEIGHLLCLTRTHEWVEQSANCVTAGTDSGSASNNYKSVMNYSYTLPSIADLENINYSNGINGTGDHDDWSAIIEGMGAFIHNGNFTQV